MIREYLFDRNWNELRYQGKILVLKDYGGRAAAILVDYNDARNFYAHAWFEASDFTELDRIFNQLGYRTGQKPDNPVPDIGMEYEIKIKVQPDRMLKLGDMLNGKLCFRMDAMHYNIEDSYLDGVLCLKDCTITYPKYSAEPMLAYIGHGFNLGVSVNNVQMALQLFNHIGCKTYPAYYMQRSAYVSGGVRVFLDSVSRHSLTGSPSQHYAVIEGEMGKAYDAAYRLGIDDLEELNEPYSKLV